MALLFSMNRVISVSCKSYQIDIFVSYHKTCSDTFSFLPISVLIDSYLLLKTSFVLKSSCVSFVVNTRVPLHFFSICTVKDIVTIVNNNKKKKHIILFIAEL